MHDRTDANPSRPFFWSNFPWNRFTMYECFTPSTQELRQKVDDPAAFRAWPMILQPPATEATCQAPLY